MPRKYNPTTLSRALHPRFWPICKVVGICFAYRFGSCCVMGCGLRFINPLLLDGWNNKWQYLVPFLNPSNRQPDLSWKMNPNINQLWPESSAKCGRELKSRLPVDLVTHFFFWLLRDYSVVNKRSGALIQARLGVTPDHGLEDLQISSRTTKPSPPRT